MAWPPETHQDATDQIDSKPARAYTQFSFTGNRTLQAAEAIDTVMHCANSTTGVTLTLPSDAAQSIAQEVPIPWRQYGTGQITFAAGTNATVHARGGALKSAGQYAEGIVTKVAANTWVVSGDLTT